MLLGIILVLATKGWGGTNPTASVVAWGVTLIGVLLVKVMFTQVGAWSETWVRWLETDSGMGGAYVSALKRLPAHKMLLQSLIVMALALRLRRHNTAGTALVARLAILQ